MDEKIRRSLYGILLKYLNFGKKNFEIYELEMTLCKSEFTFADIMKQMMKDKILKKYGRDRYEIIADIGTFRNYILEQTEEEEKIGKGDSALPLDEIMESSWTATLLDTAIGYESLKGIKTGSDDNEDSDSDDSYYANGKAYKNEHEYYEECRRELLKRLKAGIADDTANGDDAGGGDDDDDDDDDDEWDIYDENDDIYGDFDEDEDEDEDEEGYEDNKELYREALKFCMECGAASAALIQRYFPVEIGMSLKIIDWMEENKFISPRTGDNPGEILIDKNDYENIFGVPFDGKKAKLKKPEGDGSSGSSLKTPTSAREKQVAAQNIANALERIAQKNSAPATDKDVGDSSLRSDKDFEETVTERIVCIIKSDRRMGRQGAIKKAETYLEAVRDTHNERMVMVYECIIYELKSISDYFYRKLREQLSE